MYPSSNKRKAILTRLGRVKALALIHGEKVVFILIGGLTFLIVYRSITFPRLDQKYNAAALRSTIAQTNREIQNYDWKDAINSGEARRFRNITAAKDWDIDAQLYEPKRGFSLDSPVVAPMPGRTDPVILNASDVYAMGGTGMFAFVDEDVRKHRQVESAIREEEKAQQERERHQLGKVAGRTDRADQPTQPYDPDHPKRRPIDTSVRIPGVRLQGDERIERAYWACVVALVPVREQFNLYQEAFEQARGYDINHDVPRYLGFFVERAEVLRGKELNWQHVPLYDGQQKSLAGSLPLSTGPSHAIGASAVDKLYAAAAQVWAGGPAPDLVDDRLANRVLTLPLPPLVGRDWGSAATHPKIQLNSSKLEEEAEQASQPTSEDQRGATASAFSRSGIGLQSAPYGQTMGRALSAIGYGPGSSRYWGNPGEIGTAYRGGPTPNNANPYSVLATGVDYYLLRFFDFAVEPGKKYKYRVKLALADPNCDMLSKTLAPEVLDRQDHAAKTNHGRKPRFRVADDWSNPSPSVGIPIGGSIRLAAVKLPSSEKVNDEPSASLLVEMFALDKKGNAMQAATEKNFRRGDVANLVEDAEYLGPGYIDSQEGFRFFTDTTLLDIDGGKKLTRDTSAPSRILLMGPTGQLYIHSELDDKPFIEQHELLFEMPNPRFRGTGGRIAQ